MSISVVSSKNVHYVLDAVGLTRFELVKGKPKIKTVCASDKKHRTIHGWGPWTNTSISPSGEWMSIARGGYVGDAEVAIVDLENLASAGDAYRRDLRGYAGAAFLDDEHQLFVELTDAGPVLRVHSFDVAKSGGLGDKVAVAWAGKEIAVPWTTKAARQIGGTSPIFLRVASDGTWLAVSQADATAWGGTLRRVKKAWVLENGFTVKLSCSTAIRIGGAATPGRVVIEMFDQRAQSSELAVIDVAASRVELRRVDTARPLAFDAEAVYATALDGKAAVRYSLNGGAATTIAAKTPIENDVFVIDGRVYAMASDHLSFTDIERETVFQRKLPKGIDQMLAIQHLAFENRAEPFTLQRTRDVLRAHGVRHDFSGWRFDDRRSWKQPCAIVDVFHDGGLLGLLLESWVYGQRPYEERRVDGKPVQYYTQMQRRGDTAVAFGADEVVSALAALREHGIGLHDVLHERRLLIRDSNHTRREPAAFTREAVAVMLRAWCTVAQTGDLAIVATRDEPSEAEVLAAAPKLLDLLIGFAPGTRVLRSPKSDGNLDHFVSCAFHILEPAAFRKLLEVVLSNCSTVDRTHVRQHAMWVQRELGHAEKLPLAPDE